MLPVKKNDYGMIFYLNMRLDLRVIRIDNKQIDESFNGVCEYIDLQVKAFFCEEGGTTKS